MASTPGGVDLRKEKAIVYLVVSPAIGRGQRIYTDEDIQALGGIHTIEQHLEEESYWYVRLGKIQGEAGRDGVTFLQSDFGKLPEPPESAWKTGRCNPAFRSSIWSVMFLGRRSAPSVTCSTRGSRAKTEK